ncbi:DUF7281 domain-containing protein [Shewanella ulleungensis]|uniref:DUF7281 domain-containing protein n=1 Tax=Shewanella ulleungensis TaxID=2282699 RepID=UPI003D7AED96
MASVSQSQLQLLGRAAKQQLPRVAFNASWKKLYQIWQIGEPDGAEKYLYLTSKDYALLRKMAHIDSGLDILSLDFNVPRDQMAQQSANEKYANISPEADYVLIKLAPQLARYIMGDAIPHLLSAQHSALRLKVDTAVALCQQLKLSQLIVVENLDSFDNLFAYSFTPGLQPIIDSCMVLYRGSHDYSPAGRKRFLRLIEPMHINVIAFTDLDPAGLMIANTLNGCRSMIVPQQALSSPNELLAISQINSVADFNKQHKQLTYLKNVSSPTAENAAAYTAQWITLVNWISHHSVSIKQQHMLAKSLSLSLLSIKL